MRSRSDLAACPLTVGCWLLTVVSWSAAAALMTPTLWAEGPPDREELAQERRENTVAMMAKLLCSASNILFIQLEKALSTSSTARSFFLLSGFER